MLNAERAEMLLREWTANESLVKHGLSVARCTESYGLREAERLGLSGEDASRFGEEYRCAGLLHDFDYDRHPTPAEHPFVGVTYLRAQGWPEPMLHAILAHADYSGVVPETHLDKALFACDELAGFLTACALVRPSKAIGEVEVASVKKKMKDKAFARAVKREDMLLGAALLGISIDEHIGNCLRAMQVHSEELGLVGMVAG
ncbi:MAG: HD domain-containing protein [Acidobacteria bacterium]|nr:HD domain-containing protein [Acidobacteriota bacterium]